MDQKQVEYVANLAHLGLSQEESQSFATQLGEILAYVDKLSELDTEGIEPTSHVLDLSNVFREDVLGASLLAEEVLRNAPETDEPFFKVPNII